MFASPCMLEKYAEFAFIIMVSGDMLSQAVFYGLKIWIIAKTHILIPANITGFTVNDTSIIQYIYIQFKC